ncbi:hypothetical protein [Desulfogranum mediterraneum]|uniref:hypothetical protein n=1 Tax=Desulfogranum mediterraneum TaxID=160661 RepID=UPI00048FBCA7|nr:hypothetical protein [Desulfogranum mediterraneum]
MVKNHWFRKISSGLLLLVVACLGCFYLSFNFDSGPDLAELLPRETLALVQVRDLAQACTSLQRSPLGQELLAPALEQKLLILGGEERTRARILGAVEGFRRLVSHPLFGAVFSRQSALALLPAERSFSSPASYLSANTLFIARTRIKVAPSVLLGWAEAGQSSLETSVYQGAVLTTIQGPGGGSLVVAVVDTTIICALERRAVERCLELMAERLLRPRFNLANDPLYQQLRADIRGREDVLIYANPGPLAELTSLAGEDTAPHSSRFTPGQRLFFSHQAAGRQDYLQLLLRGFGDTRSGLVEQYRLAPAVYNRGLAGIGAEASIYFWTNWLDPAALWQVFSRSPTLETAGALFYIGQQVYHHTGKDIDTLSHMFGPQFSFFVQDLAGAAPERAPLLCFQFQVRDPLGVQELLNLVLEEVPTRTTSLAGGRAVSVIMADGLIQPAYLLRGDQLVVADDISMIAGLFDEQAPKLVADPDFRGVGSAFTQANNLLLYTRIDQLNQGLRQLVLWILESQEAMGQISSEQHALLLTSGVTPLFESLAHVRSQGIRLRQAGPDLHLELTLYSPTTRTLGRSEGN